MIPYDITKYNALVKLAFEEKLIPELHTIPIIHTYVLNETGTVYSEPAGNDLTFYLLLKQQGYWVLFKKDTIQLDHRYSRTTFENVLLDIVFATKDPEEMKLYMQKQDFSLYNSSFSLRWS